MLLGNREIDIPVDVIMFPLGHVYACLVFPFGYVYACLVPCLLGLSLSPLIALPFFHASSHDNIYIIEVNCSENRKTTNASINPAVHVPES